MITFDGSGTNPAVRTSSLSRFRQSLESSAGTRPGFGKGDTNTAMHKHIYAIALSLSCLMPLACDGGGGDDMFTGTLDTGDDEADGEVVAELVLGGETFIFNSGTNYRILEEEDTRTHSLIVSTESGDRTLIVTIETPGPLTTSTLQTELDVRVTSPAGGGSPALAFSSFTDNPNITETTMLTITETDGDRFTGTVEGTLIAEQGSTELEDRERMTIRGTIDTPSPL